MIKQAHRIYHPKNREDLLEGCPDTILFHTTNEPNFPVLAGISSFGFDPEIKFRAPNHFAIRSVDKSRQLKACGMEI